MSDHADVVRGVISDAYKNFSYSQWQAEPHRQKARAALDALVAERDALRALNERITVNESAFYDQARAAEARVTELEAKRDALAAWAADARDAAARVVDEYHKWSEDANDGEFAIWRSEDLINAIIALRSLLARYEEIGDHDE